MPKGWSKGHTKHSHPSVMKISRTMKIKKIDNFFCWREKMRLCGRIPPTDKALDRDGDLAEFVGVVLGDGHLSRFPRTEELTIFSNSNNAGFVKRYAGLMENIFNKKPYVAKSNKVNCTRIRIYQKDIKRHLGVPYSPRLRAKIQVPRWILENRNFIVRYLRGLYEAEGSFCVHKPTSTYKLFFTNRNESLMRIVFRLMKRLGFHPHRSESNHSVQISRKEEVERAVALLQFRKY